jgi:hypothetical protein
LNADPVCGLFVAHDSSLAWPDAAGGLGRTWSIAAIVCGVALLAAVLSADPRRATPADRLTG